MSVEGSPWEEEASPSGACCPAEDWPGGTAVDLSWRSSRFPPRDYKGQINQRVRRHRGRGGSCREQAFPQASRVPGGSSLSVGPGQPSQGSFPEAAWPSFERRFSSPQGSLPPPLLDARAAGRPISWSGSAAVQDAELS